MNQRKETHAMRNHVEKVKRVQHDQRVSHRIYVVEEGCAILITSIFSLKMKKAHHDTLLWNELLDNGVKSYVEGDMTNIKWKIRLWPKG